MTKGIHHITAIASNAQINVHFYSKVLGLRLVKKTVNQDDTSTYHLFFGDKSGHPGMDLTFFIFQPSMPGRRGTGLVTTISLAVPVGSLPFWKQRFIELKVKHDAVSERFAKKRLVFFDDDNQQLELVETPQSEDSEIWITRDIKSENAIRSFHSANLSVVSRTTIEPLLTHVFGYEHMSTDGHIHFYKTNASSRANYLEVSEEPSQANGLNAAGTVHHIAFRATDEAEQSDMRKKVEELGLFPTEVIDRFYFKSVYFRTPAGILFEIATDSPGFTADEKEDDLGKKLALPPFLEHQRAAIESQLPIVTPEE
ncbi:MAG: ring-cleaving dioxygenase [bacterium]|nr:ring-cleaving dioxygenase [bacterium]